MARYAMFSLFPSVLVPVLVWFLLLLFEQVEFVCYVFHGEQARWRPLNLELILQRCSEVQHWVATEILQCQSLPKRIQLLRKFIKIAALWVHMCVCAEYQLNPLMKVTKMNYSEIVRIVNMLTCDHPRTVYQHLFCIQQLEQWFHIQRG